MAAMKAGEIHRAYGAQVKRLRQLLGMNQHDFGAAVGWPQATVSDIEVGKRKLTIDEVDALAEWAATQLDGWSKWDVVLFIHSKEAFRPSLRLVGAGDGASNGDVGSADGHTAKGGYRTPEPTLRAVSGL